MLFQLSFSHLSLHPSCLHTVLPVSFLYSLLNELYCLAGSFINDFNISLTHILYVLYDNKFFNFVICITIELNRMIV